MYAPVTASERFSTLDWIGAVFASFSAFGLLMFPLAGRTFAGMFNDLGSRETLPLLTKLATSMWFPVVLAVPVIAALIMGFRQNRPLTSRRAWVVGAFVLAGVVADIGIRAGAKPHLVASTASLALWSSFFALAAWSYTIDWSPELWAGAIVFAAASSALLAAVTNTVRPTQTPA